MPQHTSAIQLAADLEAAAELAAAQAAAEAEEARIEQTLSTSVAAADLANVTEAEPIPVDPIPEYLAAFDETLAENRLLTPAEQSSKYFAGLMPTENSDDARAVESRRQLFERFLDRARDAVEAQDTQAATTWIDEAELLGVNETAVAEARSILTERLIEMESLKRVPASALERLEYTPPAYPMRAVTRNIEG